MRIVATTSLPAVDRPNADRWNAARSCQKVLVRADLPPQTRVNTRVLVDCVLYSIILYFLTILTNSVLELEWQLSNLGNC